MSDEEFNEKWDTRKIAEETFKSMYSHSEPSPETRERLVYLETNQTNLMEKLEGVEKKVDDGFKEIKDLLKEAMAQKANKWVEKVFIWFLITIATGLLAYLGTLLLKLIAIHL